MLFVSENDPDLDLSHKPGLHGVRFAGGYCEVNRPRAVAILQSSWWQRRGVRVATDDDRQPSAEAGRRVTGAASATLPVMTAGTAEGNTNG